MALKMMIFRTNLIFSLELDWLNSATASVDDWASWEGKDILVDGKISGEEVQIPQDKIINIKLPNYALIPKIRLFRTQVK